MTDYQKYINALRKCAKEHENDRTFTGHIVISDLCRDTANLLEELEQEPTTKNNLEVDCISRKAVINQIFYSTDNNGDVVLGSALRERIARLPSVTPQLTSGLEKNSKKLEKDFGELDCISRVDAIKAMQDKAKKITNEDTINGLCGAVAILFDMPSVTPQEPRKGHWIEYSWNDNGLARWGLECDKCYKKYKYGGEIWNNPNFCPNCGAKMVEPQESEDKE